MLLRSKAIFLLTVFLFNSVIGFVCALHIGNDETAEISELHDHHHHQVSKHEHVDLKSSNHNIISSVSSKDICCQDAVSAFNSLSKIVPSSGNDLIKAHLFPINFLNTRIRLVTSNAIKGYTSFITTRQRPPTTAIRIIIRSFQI